MTFVIHERQVDHRIFLQQTLGWKVVVIDDADADADDDYDADDDHDHDHDHNDDDDDDGVGVGACGGLT